MNTKNFMRAFHAVLFFSGCICWPIAHSQVWQVRSMLEKVNTPFIQLKDKDGAVTDKISRAWVQRVADVTDRMAAVYGLPAPALFINKQNGPNAFVTNGKNGPLMVMGTDMLRVVGDSDDLMAAVIGHELGHLKANHLTTGANAEAVVSFIGLFAGLMLDVDQAKKGVDTQGLGMKLGSIGSGLVNAKFTRDQEREADNLGIRNMASAGFDPRAASRLWRLMESQGAGGSGLWMSSHPSNEERYQTMQKVATSLGSSYAAIKPPPPQLDGPVNAPVVKGDDVYVAFVNGRGVPAARVNALSQQIARSGRPVTPEAQDQIKNEVISREIFMQEAKTLGLDTSDDYFSQIELARQTILIRELFAHFQKNNPVTDKTLQEKKLAEYQQSLRSNAKMTNSLLGASDETLVFVNDKPVPTARVDALAQQLARSGRPVTPEMQGQIKNEVIAREIFVQEARKLGLDTSDDYIAQIELARQTLLIRELFERYKKNNPIADKTLQDKKLAEYQQSLRSNAKVN